MYTNEELEKLTLQWGEDKKRLLIRRWVFYKRRGEIKC
jgi:hypothetical protein